MENRPAILNAALKALLAGAETSACLKIPATFIAELAGMSKDQRQTLDPTLPDDRFQQLLTQSELSTGNAALAAVGAQQLKKMIANSFNLTKNQLKNLTTLTQQELENIFAHELKY